jgi:hypothetical protein
MLKIIFLGKNTVELSEVLATEGISGPLNQDMAKTPWVRAWDARVQEPWEKHLTAPDPAFVGFLSRFSNIGESIRVHQSEAFLPWFGQNGYIQVFPFTGTSSQEESGCGLPPGHAKVHQTHIRDTHTRFYRDTCGVCEAFHEVLYGCMSWANLISVLCSREHCYMY